MKKFILFLSTIGCILIIGCSTSCFIKKNENAQELSKQNNFDNSSNSSRASITPKIQGDIIHSRWVIKSDPIISRWHKLSQHTFIDIDVAPNGIVWAVAESGRVYYFKDDEWNPTDLYNIKKISANDTYVYACNRDGQVIRSNVNSYGATFTPVLITEDISDITVQPNGKVWVIDRVSFDSLGGGRIGGRVYYSTNNGNNWRETGQNDCIAIAANDNYTYAVSYYNRLLYKHSSSSTFTNTNHRYYKDIAVEPDGTVWAVKTNNGEVWFSLNNGINWNNTNRHGFNRIGANNKFVYTTAEDGYIWYYNNNKYKWINLQHYSFKDVAVEPDGTLWAVGKYSTDGYGNNTLWQSEDNGIQMTPTLMTDVLSIDANNSNVLICKNDYHIYRHIINDNDFNWINTNWHSFIDIGIAPNDNTFLTISQGKRIFKSDKYGNNLKDTGLLNNNRIAVGNKYAYICWSSGYLFRFKYRSANITDWKNLNAYSFKDVAVEPDGTVWAVSKDAGELWYSEDNGNTWGYTNMTGFETISANNLYTFACHSSGRIWRASIE